MQDINYRRPQKIEEDDSIDSLEKSRRRDGSEVVQPIFCRITFRYGECG